MRTTVIFTLGLFLLAACGTKSHDSQILLTANTSSNATGQLTFTDFINQFDRITPPFIIGDSMIWKSTYVKMEGLKSIDNILVDKFLSFEIETKDTIQFHDLLKFYYVGQLQSADSIFKIIYLKSYESIYVAGGKKDIYRLVTLNKTGQPISQTDIAGFITYTTNAADKSYWNTCNVTTDSSILLTVKDELNDYDKDTSYVLSTKIETVIIRKDGTTERKYYR